MKTALVLSGGGSLGAIQVGMLRALAESGFRPDMVVGASVGAINAAYFAWSPDMRGVEGLEGIWRNIRRSTVFPWLPLRGLAAALSLASSFSSPKNLRKMLEENLKYENLEDTAVPCHAVATNIANGELVLLSSGNAIDALIASASVPGMFPTVDYEGMKLTDGSVGSNTPISVAVELGAEKVVVLPAGFSCMTKEPPRGAFGTISNALNHIITRQLMHEIHLYRDKVSLHVAPALCPLAVNSGDFSQMEHLRSSGYHAAVGWIDAGGITSVLPSNLHPHNL